MRQGTQIDSSADEAQSFGQVALSRRCHSSCPEMGSAGQDRRIERNGSLCANKDPNDPADVGLAYRIPNEVRAHSSFEERSHEEGYRPKTESRITAPITITA